jgi:predicted nucleic acid-binding protein
VIVVVDTNVWISGLQFAKRRGTPTLALEKAMSEDVLQPVMRSTPRSCAS